MDIEEYFGGAVGGGGSYFMDDGDGTSGMNMVGAAAAAAAASNPFLYDQEEEAAAAAGGSGAGAGAVLSPTGALAEPEEPIFNPARVEYAFTRLVHMAIASKHVVLAFATNKLQLFSLDRPGNIDEVEVTRRSDDQIYKAFIDPSGNHILVTTRCEENFYLHWGSKKVRPLQKMRGLVIESVAWDMQNTSTVPTAAPTVASLLGQADGSTSGANSTDGAGASGAGGEGGSGLEGGEEEKGMAMLTAAQTTRSFLVGTRNGRIYEVCIEAPPERRMMDLMMRQEYLFRPVHALAGPQPITGLRFERFPPTLEHPIKYFVVATTATRLYQFVGGPTFEAMMLPYEQNPSFQEMPPGEGDSSARTGDQLAFFYRAGGSAQAFAWLTGPGVYHGKLVYGSQEVGDAVTQDCSFLAYSVPASEHRAAPGRAGAHVPIAVLMTEFHYLLLYEHTLQCVNVLSEESVFEFEIHDRAGQVRGFAQDPMGGTVWVYCENCIYEIVITREDRDVWRLCMERKEWATAIEYCKKDPRKENTVWIAQAANYFAENKFELAARYYAMTREPFEEVALMFINKDKRDALKTYLLQKLAKVPLDATTQMTVIATWLVEIFLNKLNVLTDRVQELQNAISSPADSDDSKNKTTAATAQSSTTASSTIPGIGQDSSLEDKLEAAQSQLKMVQFEFRNFLSEYRERLHPATTFNLISSHGRVDDMVFYSDLIGDYERVLSHYFRVHDYAQGLATLEKLPAQHADLVYKLSPTLISIMPVQTVDCWLKLKYLQPKRLFPALIHYEETAARHCKHGENQAIRYLHACVKDGNMEPAVHNYLLALLAQRACDADATVMDSAALLGFLDGNGTPVCYDLKYALRLCTKLNEVEACVLIYSKMGLYEEAVDLALTKDIGLAKDQANKPDDDAVKRRLWLKIAQKVVHDSNDIRVAMEFLHSCDLLKIEDILPFFSEFTRIDDFKDEICRSLEEYNNHMHTLRAEMNEAKQAASAIRHDIHDLRNRCGVVRAGQLCDHCHHLALTRSLYLFPCGHVFHIDCLIDFTRPLMTPERRARVQQLVASIAAFRHQHGAQPADDPGTVAAPQAALTPQQKSSVDSLRVQLDNLVAAECPLCGDMMIRLIEVPFIQPHEPAIAQWAI